MAEEDVTLWGIHAGKTGDADGLFLKKGYVAIGWVDMGDLGTLAPNRDAFKAKAAEVYPEAKARAIPSYAGQTFRFVHEMKPGDIVIYPSKHDRQIHIGRIEGDYQYNPNLEPGYPNQRPATWLCAVPRTKFTKGALNEIGASLSLFRVKNHANEFIAALEGVPSLDSALADQILHLIRETEAGWRQKLATSEARITDLEEENTELGRKLAASPSPLDDITDEGLRRRIALLTSAPLDTIMREAGVVLEDRFRRIAGPDGRSEQGVRLVRAVLDPDKPKLVFSAHRGEQTGVLKLYEGAIQFIRNPPMHRLMDYPDSTASLLLRLIDALLLLLSEGEPPGPAHLDLVRRMLTRIPIPDGQLALYRALYSAGDEGMTQSELATALGRTVRQLSGVLGALGARINKTEGLEDLGGTTVVFECQRSGGEWWYRMRPLLRTALEAEGLV